MSSMLMGSELIEHSAGVAAGQRYTLTVLNENSRFQQFALFQTLPDIIGPWSNPVSLAWMIGGAAGGSPVNPSQSQFLWLIDYAANAGYIRDIGSPADPRIFLAAAQVSVQVNTQNSLAITYDGSFPNGAPVFPRNPTNGIAGLIQVQSDGTIPTAVQQASFKFTLDVGLAMSGKATVAVQLLPNLLYQFTPKPRYYIVSGSFVQGQVIDASVFAQAFEVLYQGVTDRTIVFGQDGQFRNA